VAGGPVSGAGGPVSGAAGLEREVECAVRGGIPQPTVIWTLGDVPLEATSVGRDPSGPLCVLYFVFLGATSSPEIERDREKRLR
jgi:phage tail sheath gpL-like